MKTYTIYTPHGTKYVIDEDGCFLQCDVHKWKHPHDTWKCTGCAERAAFGNMRFYSLPEFLSMIENNELSCFKNGKPCFTLTDLDHGTNRLHGNMDYHGIRTAHLDN